jgi:MATE family multidrug resistance protein
MLMTVFLSLFVFIVPVYLTVIVLDYGLMVAWVFATAYIILLGLVFYVRFLGGKWKTMRVIERKEEIPIVSPTKLGRVAKL